MSAMKRIIAMPWPEKRGQNVTENFMFHIIIMNINLAFNIFFDFLEVNPVKKNLI